MRTYSGRVVLVGFFVVMIGTFLLYVWIARDVEPLRSQVGDVVRPEDPDTPELTLPAIPRFPIETMEPAVREQFEFVLRKLDIAPADANANAELAYLFHAYGFETLAVPCYRRALAFGDDWRWQYGLGVALYEIGEWEAATVELEAAYGANDRLTWAAYYWAESMRRLGRYEEAVGGFMRTLELSPTNARALLGAARAELALGNIDLAANYIGDTLKIFPDYGAARYVMARVQRARGNAESAEMQMELAEKHRDEEPPLSDAFIQMLAAQRTGAIDALHRGIDLAQQGRFNAAVEFLERAVAANPDLPEAQSQLGATYLALGRSGEADTHLRRAVELDPNSADAHYHLGLLAHRFERYDDAVASFREAISIRPEHFDALLGLGSDLPQLGRYDEAIQELQAASALRPDDTRPYKRMARTRQRQGLCGEAESILLAAIDRRPRDLSLLDRAAWLYATCPDEGFRKPIEALAIAERIVLQTSGKEPRAMATMAAALAADGRFAEAGVTAEQARQAAVNAGNGNLAAMIADHIAAYRAGQSWVDGF